MTKPKPKRARQLGVTDQEYQRLLEAQGGHCALCPNTPKTRRLHVDHDHATGRVRGLLCHRCNRALPTWVTSDWLAGAVRYLDRPLRDSYYFPADPAAYLEAVADSIRYVHPREPDNGEQVGQILADLQPYTMRR